MIVTNGIFYNGHGNAHEHCKQHDSFFSCRLKGTFNIRAESPIPYKNIPPAFSGIGEVGEEYKYIKYYYFVRLRHNQQIIYAWAFRWQGSKMPEDRIEILSREPIPDIFKEDNIEVTFLRKWTPEEITEWCKNQYWFQSFDWGPYRADSNLIWRTIYPMVSWSCKAVLDVGTHYGYFAFKAAKAGANVVGFDPDNQCIRIANTIKEHIEQFDPVFRMDDPGGEFDIILYLSVHHQIDPTYDNLKETIDNYKLRCKDLFVELIMPDTYPLFGNGKKNEDVDKLVGGLALHTYKHNVRGVRRIYHVKGELK